MIELLSILFAIIIVLSAGRLLFSLKIFSIEGEPVGIRLPLYFFAGTVVLSLLMFLLFLLKIKFSVFNISFLFIIYIVYYILKNYMASPDKIQNALKYYQSLLRASLEKQNLIFSSLLLLLSLAVVIVFFENLAVPPYVGDSYFKWFFKAKMIFMNRTIPSDLLANLNYYYTCPDYPLLVPLNMAWFAVCLGRWSDTIVKTFFSVSYLSLMVFFYYSLKKHIEQFWALAGTFIIFLIPGIINAATNGYADFSVSAFVTLSAILLYNWFEENGRTNQLLLSGFFIGAAAWTKNDGFAELAAVMITLTLFLIAKLIRKNEGFQLHFAVSKLLAYIAMAGVVFAPFNVFIAISGMKNHMISGPSQLFAISSNLWRAPYIFNQFIYEFFLDTSRWVYFWIFFFILLITNKHRSAKTNLKYLLVFILLVFAALFGVFMIRNSGSTVGSLMKNVEELERLLLQIAPTAGFMMFLTTFKSEPKKNEQ